MSSPIVFPWTQAATLQMGGAAQAQQVTPQDQQVNQTATITVQWTSTAPDANGGTSVVATIQDANGNTLAATNPGSGDQAGLPWLQQWMTDTLTPIFQQAFSQLPPNGTLTIQVTEQSQ